MTDKCKRLHLRFCTVYTCMVLERDGFSTSHGIRWAFLDVVPNCFVFNTFLVHMLGGSYKEAMCHFACLNYTIN